MSEELAGQGPLECRVRPLRPYMCWAGDPEDGAVLAWARALGEFGATITFAGNFPGRTQTMPLATYLALERDPDDALLISLVLIAVSLVVLLGLRDRWLGTGREIAR